MPLNFKEIYDPPYPGIPPLNVPFFSAQDYGAIGNGVANDTLAIQDAIDSAYAAGGGIVYLLAGSYLLLPGLNPWCLNLKANVTLKGAGTWATVLIDNSQHTTAPDTIHAAANNVAVEDLSVLGNAAAEDSASGSGGYAVSFQNSTNFRLSNFQADNMLIGPWRVGSEQAIGSCSQGHINNVWCHGGRMNLGYLACCTDVNVNNVYGESREGFCIEGGPCSRINISNVIAWSKSTSTGLGFGIEILANWGDLRDISITNVQVLGNFLCGLRAYASANTGPVYYSITDLSLSNIHTDGNNQPGSNVGFQFKADTGCVFDGLTGSNLIARRTAQSAGFNFDNVTGEMSNCLSESNFNQGYALTNSADIRFTNCRALENNQQNQAGNAGFYLQSNSTATLVNCKASSTKTGYGVNAVTSGTNIVYADRCDFTGNTTGAINVVGASASIIKNCLGYNPRGHSVSQPSIPASTVAFTNPDVVDCTVFITGGTVSAIAIGGTSTGFTSGVFRIPARQTITLTYTVAPTWVWFGD